MAKFDINSSRYAKFFSDKSNQKFLQTFLDTEGIIYTNYGWYKTQGRKAALPTPTDAAGLATFTIKARKLEAAPLMDLRAPLGDSNQMDATGIDFYSASIPDFIAKGYVETAMEREARARQFEIFGNDADIVAQWVANVQSQTDQVDATLNNMTAQLESKGLIDWTDIGQGIRLPLHKANISGDNFVKAGAKVWTDTANCKVLEQMKQIEDSFREKWGYTGALKWLVPRKMYHEVILENEQVKELIKSYKSNPLVYHATTEGQSFTDSAFRIALNDYEGLSPIEVVTEKERNLTHAADKFVHGWKENIAVLRPAGDAVEFQYKDNLDQQLFEKYGASVASKLWAKTNDGLGTLVNTILNNGLYKEWHTDVMLSAVPALVEFPYHVIVDTTTASE